jgi:Rrf2 family protein
MVELAAAKQEWPVKGERIAQAQGIPIRFLENILAELRQQGLVASRRGADGGYWLARTATDISIADVIRAVEGPLASIRGERPDEIEYQGTAEPLQRVWIALRANVQEVLEGVSLKDVIRDEIPGTVDQLAEGAEPSQPR